MRQILKGATDQSVVIRIVDSGDGTPETGVEHNTSGIDLWYRREGATKTSITEAALAALDSAHSDGGIEHIGDGYYRLDLPDAAVASGANGVMVGGTVTGMVVIGTYVHLTDYDPQDGVNLGITALPDAPPDAAGGLIISDAGGLDADAMRSDVAAILVDTGTTLDGKINAIDDLLDTEFPALVLDVAAILVDTSTTLDDLVDGLESELAKVPKSDGTVSWNPTALAAINAEADTALADYDGPTHVEMTTAISDAETALNSSVPGAVWDVDATGHQTQGTFGQAIGDPVADSDTIWALVNTNLNATVSSRASQTSVDTIDDFLDTEVAATLAAVDTEVAAILVDTGTDIPATLAALFTTAQTESYNTDGATATVAQLLYGIFQTLTEGAISGTGWTVKKLNGTDTAFGITLDSAVTPTTKTRSS